MSSYWPSRESGWSCFIDRIVYIDLFPHGKPCFQSQRSFSVGICACIAAHPAIIARAGGMEARHRPFADDRAFEFRESTEDVEDQGPPEVVVSVASVSERKPILARSRLSTVSISWRTGPARRSARRRRASTPAAGRARQTHGTLLIMDRYRSHTMARHRREPEAPPALRTA